MTISPSPRFALTLLDRMAVRHGRYLDQCLEDKRTFRFTRDELGLLVDFMAELMKREGHQLIGVRGMPRVGKTESIVASSVCANKRWTLSRLTCSARRCAVNWRRMR